MKISHSKELDDINVKIQLLESSSKTLELTLDKTTKENLTLKTTIQKYKHQKKTSKKSKRKFANSIDNIHSNNSKRRPSKDQRASYLDDKMQFRQ